MSADRHKQTGIRRAARSFQLRGGFIKENENFENSQELKVDQKNLKTRSDS
jgi:hypothetical protein